MIQSIPVVDFTDFRNGSASDRKRVAKELGRAAETLGFAVIGGRGVASRLGEYLREVGLRFFDLALDGKMKVRRPKNDKIRGYIFYGEETLVRMSGGRLA